MESFIPIDVHLAYEKIQNQEAQLIDIRDQESFERGHIANTFHLTQGNLIQLLDQFDYSTPLIVMCYHGVSSRQVAQYLLSQGFEEIYNLEGGFCAWQASYPIVSETKPA